MATYQLKGTDGQIDIKARSLLVMGVPITTGATGPPGPQGIQGIQGPVGPIGPENPNATTLQGATWAVPLVIGSGSPNIGVFTNLTCTALNATTASTTTKVTNLNADLLDGNDWGSPGTIGGVTPGVVNASSVNVSGLTALMNVTTDASKNLVTVPLVFPTPKSAYMSITQCARMAKGRSINTGANYWQQDIVRYTTAVIGDHWACEFVIAAGTYNLTVMGVKVANSGIWDFQINGAGPILAVDMYSNPTVIAYELPGSFVIPTSGVYTLTFQTNSQNGGSTGYSGYFNSFSLWDSVAI